MHHILVWLPCLSELINHFSLFIGLLLHKKNTMCCVTFLYLVQKGPDIQEQLCRQGKEKEGSRRVLTSHSASSDSSAALLLFHPHAVSLSPSVFIQWLAALACHTMKTAQKWLLWKLSPTGRLCHPSHSNIASCWVALSERLRLFWCQWCNFGVTSIFSSVFGQFWVSRALFQPTFP